MKGIYRASGVFLELFFAFYARQKGEHSVSAWKEFTGHVSVMDAGASV
jgi:hypothetical protein